MFARIENGKVVEVVDSSPKGRFHPDIAAQFVACENTILPGCSYSEGKFFPDTNSTVTLTEAQATKRAAITAGFDAAITASLTMPSAGASPSAFEVATALFDWRTEDPDGFAALLAIHTARRDELLAAVEAATTPEAVLAIAVSYAV